MCSPWNKDKERGKKRKKVDIEQKYIVNAKRTKDKEENERDTDVYRAKKISFKSVGLRNKNGRKIYKEKVKLINTFMP